MTAFTAKHLQRNLVLLRGFTVLRAALIVYSVLVPYLLFKGLETGTVFLLQGVIYSGLLVIMDVPAGHLADRIGRRKTLFIGAVILLLGHFLMFWGSGLNAMILSFVASGIGSCLLSGVPSALLYDSLKSAQQLPRYRKQESKLKEYGYYANALAGLMGGVMFSFNVHLPILLTMLAMFLAVFLPLLMHEPKVERKRELKKAHLEIYDVLHYALKGHDEIKWLLLLAFSIMPMTWLGFWLAQSFWVEIGISPVYYGFFNAGLLFVAAFGARIFPKLLSVLSLLKIALIMALLISVAFIVQGFYAVSYVIVLQLLVSLSFGISDPMFTDLINHRVSSDIRASMVSVLSLINRLGIVLLSLLMTPLMGIYTASDLFVGSGVLVLCIALPVIALLQKKGVFAQIS